MFPDSGHFGTLQVPLPDLSTWPLVQFPPLSAREKRERWGFFRWERRGPGLTTVPARSRKISDSRQPSSRLAAVWAIFPDRSAKGFGCSTKSAEKAPVIGVSPGRTRGRRTIPESPPLAKAVQEPVTARHAKAARKGDPRRDQGTRSVFDAGVNLDLNDVRHTGCHAPPPRRALGAVSASKASGTAIF